SFSSSTTGPIVADADTIYFVSQPPDTLYSLPIAGGSLTTLLTTFNSANNTTSDPIDGLAVDDANVYAANYGSIWKIPKGGGTTQTLASGGGWGGAIAVKGDYLYGLGTGAGVEVYRVPVAGGKVETLVSGQAARYADIAVDDANVYWVDLSYSDPWKGGKL